MSMTGVLGIVGLFGIVCAFYVSVVGFALTAVMLTAVMFLFSAVTTGFIGGWDVLTAFVVMQIGYAAGLVVSALVGHVRGVSPKYRRPIVNDLNVHHE